MFGTGPFILRKKLQMTSFGLWQNFGHQTEISQIMVGQKRSCTVSAVGMKSKISHRAHIKMKDER